MTRLVRWAGGIVVLACVFALGSWVLRQRRAEASAEREEAAKVAARIERNAAGEAIVKLDRDALERAGVRDEVVAATEVDPEVVAYGRIQEDPATVFVLRAPVAGTLRAAEGQDWPSVGKSLPDGAVAGLVEPRLAPAERIALMERLAAARAETAAAQAALAAAKAAYGRARTLNADNKNVSDRALQEAEAHLKGEEARVAGAAETMRLLEAVVRQPAATPLTLARGGQVVEVMAQPGEAVESGQPLLRVVRFERLLVRVEVPAGEVALPGVTSARIVALGHEDRPLTGERIALVAAADPTTQGQAFVFRIEPGGLPLRPGMATTAYLRAPGARRRGVVAPPSAVVHTEGGAWVYVRIGEGVFERRTVTLECPHAGGWFIPKGLAAGDRLVTTGAQALLGEEYKSQNRGGEEDEAH